MHNDKTRNHWSSNSIDINALYCWGVDGLSYDGWEMTKFRIVKRPMWQVVGLVDFMGYSETYIIEKKGWFGWGMIPNTHHISLKECEKHLEDILTDKYDGDRYIVKEYTVEGK